MDEIHFFLKRSKPKVAHTIWDKHTFICPYYI